jgi:hypothetical protein
MWKQNSFPQLVQMLAGCIFAAVLQGATEPVITSATANFANTPATLTVTGTNFGTVAPTLTLGSNTLRVSGFSDITVVAALPAGLAAGVYLTLTTGGKPSDSAGMDVTLGSVGPPGPQGQPGAPGPMGVNGISFVYSANIPSPQQFTVPTGVTTILIEAWGGGGGDAANTNGGGQYGGAGGYARGLVSVVPGTIYQVYVGAPGVAGFVNLNTSTCAPGTGGGATYIASSGGTTLIAAGGGGGGSVPNGGFCAPGANGGNGGSAPGAPSTIGGMGGFPLVTTSFALAPYGSGGGYWLNGPNGGIIYPTTTLPLPPSTQGNNNTGLAGAPANFALPLSLNAPIGIAGGGIPANQFVPFYTPPGPGLVRITFF